MYQKTVEVPQVRTVRDGTRSFRSTTAKLWNSLPQYFRDTTSFNFFKIQINAWCVEPVHVRSVQIVDCVLNLFHVVSVS